MLIEAALALAMLQTATVKNPRNVEFTCPDHAIDTEHELDIVRTSDGVVVQTILLGDPAAADGVVRTTINVQPVAFGEYVARVRVVAGTVKSDSSPDSNRFERAPGQPGSVIVR